MPTCWSPARPGRRGFLPLTLAAIEGAIRLNGAAVDHNLAAFALGRAAVAGRLTLAVQVADPSADPEAAWAAHLARPWRGAAGDIAGGRG